MESTFQFLITFITISKSTCNYQGCSLEATCDVEFVAEAVYACGGEWSDPGVANGEYLCGDGYTICDDHVYASSLGLTQELCLNSTLIQPNHFYASLQSSSGNLICDDIGFDDIFGCASYESDHNLVCTAYDNCNTIQCGPFGAQMSTFQSTALQYGWDIGQDTTQELQTTIHTTSIGGVLCCKQIPSYSTTIAYTTSQSYIRSVSCDDVMSGNISNGEIDSYNFENIPSDTRIYVLSDCNTAQNIKFKSYQMSDNNKIILTESYSNWWVQCKEAQGLEFTIWSWDINSTYVFDVYTEYDNGLTSQYHIRLSCGQQPKENISPGCYIGCGESVTGYYEYGTPQFCEITSFTKGFGGNVFSGCGSNYFDQQLTIYPDDKRQSGSSFDDQLCMGRYATRIWYNMNETQISYLQIGGSESGDYTVSMECGIPTNLSGYIHCPGGIITGSLNSNEFAWYEVHFDSNIPATFDGCLSDDGIRINLYDSQLVDAYHLLQHVNGRCNRDVDYYELYPSNNDTYYLEIIYHPDINNPSNIDTYYSYDIHVSCGEPPKQPQTTAVTSGNSIFTTASSNSITNSETTSVTLGNSIFTTVSSNTITNSETLTAHPTDVLVTESISTTKKVVNSNSGVIITLEWVKRFLLLQILMMM